MNLIFFLVGRFWFPLPCGEQGGERESKTFRFRRFQRTMSRRGASPFSVAQRPLRAGRATKPARFYDEVRDREGAEEEKKNASEATWKREGVFFLFFFAGPFSAKALSAFFFFTGKHHLILACSCPQYPPLTNRRTAWLPSRESSWAN